MELSWIKLDKCETIALRPGFRESKSPWRRKKITYYYHKFIILLRGGELGITNARWGGESPESAVWEGFQFPMRSFPWGLRFTRRGKSDQPVGWMYWEDLKNALPLWNESQSTF